MNYFQTQCLPLVPPPFAKQSFVWQPLYVHQRPVRGPQRHLSREKEEMTPRSSAQEEKQPHGAARGLPTPHSTLISSLPGGGWPLLCPPSSKPGWGESRNPEEVQQFQDAITQEGQTSFESLIFKSEHLENSTAPPFLTAHHPLKRKASCLLTQTQNSLSQRLTYPF